MPFNKKKILIISLPLLLAGGVFILELFCPFTIVDYKINKVRYGDIPALTTAIERFALDTKRYPTTKEGLIVLVNKPDEFNLETWPYIKKVNTDPWGNDYIYKLEKQKNVNYFVYSKGPDGVDNQGGYDDIVNWEKEYKCNYYGTCPTLCDSVQSIYMLILLISWIILVLFVIYATINVIIKKIKA